MKKLTVLIILAVIQIIDENTLTYRIRSYFDCL